MSSASPRGGGGPRADVGEYGDFMGTLQQISALEEGEMWGFFNALLSGRMWGLLFCSTERRLGTIDLFARSMARWRRDKFRTAYKLLRIEKVDFFFKYSQEC